HGSNRHFNSEYVNAVLFQCGVVDVSPGNACQVIVSNQQACCVQFSTTTGKLYGDVVLGIQALCKASVGVARCQGASECSRHPFRNLVHLMVHPGGGDAQCAGCCVERFGR